MRDLNVTLLKPGKYQPRSQMDEASLNELAILHQSAGHHAADSGAAACR